MTLSSGKPEETATEVILTSNKKSYSKNLIILATSAGSILLVCLMGLMIYHASRDNKSNKVQEPLPPAPTLSQKLAAQHKDISQSVADMKKNLDVSKLSQLKTDFEQLQMDLKEAPQPIKAIYHEYDMPINDFLCPILQEIATQLVTQINNDEKRLDGESIPPDHTELEAHLKEKQKLLETLRALVVADNIPIIIQLSLKEFRSKKKAALTYCLAIFKTLLSLTESLTFDSDEPLVNLKNAIPLVIEPDAPTSEVPITFTSTDDSTEKIIKKIYAFQINSLKEFCKDYVDRNVVTREKIIERSFNLHQKFGEIGSANPLIPPEAPPPEIVPPKIEPEKSVFLVEHDYKLEINPINAAILLVWFQEKIGYYLEIKDYVECKKHLASYKLNSAYIRKFVPDFIDSNGANAELNAILYAIWRITYIPVAKTLVEFLEKNPLPDELVADFIDGEGAFLKEKEKIALVNPHASTVLFLDTINDICVPHSKLEFKGMDLLDMLPALSIINPLAFGLTGQLTSSMKIGSPKLGKFQMKSVPSLFTLKYVKTPESPLLPTPSGKVTEIKFEGDFIKEEELNNPFIPISKKGIGFIKEFGDKILANFSAIYNETLSWKGFFKTDENPIDESLYNHIGYGTLQLLYRKTFGSNPLFLNSFEFGNSYLFPNPRTDPRAIAILAICNLHQERSGFGVTSPLEKSIFTQGAYSFIAQTFLSTSDVLHFLFGFPMVAYDGELHGPSEIKCPLELTSSEFKRAMALRAHRLGIFSRMMDGLHIANGVFHSLYNSPSGGTFLSENWYTNLGGKSVSGHFEALFRPNAPTCPISITLNGVAAKSPDTAKALAAKIFSLVTDKKTGGKNMDKLIHFYFMMNGSPSFALNNPVLNFEIEALKPGATERFYLKAPNILHIVTNIISENRLFTIFNNIAQFDLPESLASAQNIDTLYTRLVAWTQDPITPGNVATLVDFLTLYREELKSVDLNKPENAKYSNSPLLIKDEPPSVCIIKFLFEQMEGHLNSKGDEITWTFTELNTLKSIIGIFPVAELEKSQLYVELSLKITNLHNDLMGRVKLYNELKTEAITKFKNLMSKVLEKYPFERPIPESFEMPDPESFVSPEFKTALLNLPCSDPKLPRASNPDTISQLFIQYYFKDSLDPYFEKIEGLIKKNQIDPAKIIYDNLKLWDDTFYGASLLKEDFDQLVNKFSPNLDEVAYRKDLSSCINQINQYMEVIDAAGLTKSHSDFNKCILGRKKSIIDPEFPVPLDFKTTIETLAKKREPVLFAMLEAEYINLYKSNSPLSLDLDIKKRYLNVAGLAHKNFDMAPLDEILVEKILNVFYMEMRRSPPTTNMSLRFNCVKTLCTGDNCVLYKLDERFKNLQLFVQYRTSFDKSFANFNTEFKNLETAIIDSKLPSDFVYSAKKPIAPALVEKVQSLYPLVHKVKLYTTDFIRLFGATGSLIKEHDQKILKELEISMNKRLEDSYIPTGNFPADYPGFTSLQHIINLMGDYSIVEAAGESNYSWAKFTMYKLLAQYSIRFLVPPFAKLVFKEPFIYNVNNLPPDSIFAYFESLDKVEKRKSFIDLLAYIAHMQIHSASMQIGKPVLFEHMASGMYLKYIIFLLNIPNANESILKAYDAGIKENNISLTFNAFKQAIRKSFITYPFLEKYIEQAYELYPSKVIVDEFVRIRTPQVKPKAPHPGTLYPELISWVDTPITFVNFLQFVGCLTRYRKALDSFDPTYTIDPKFIFPPILKEGEPISVCIINHLYTRLEKKYKNPNLSAEDIISINDEMKILKKIIDSFPKEELTKSKLYTQLSTEIPQLEKVIKNLTPKILGESSYCQCISNNIDEAIKLMEKTGPSDLSSIHLSFCDCIRNRGKGVIDADYPVPPSLNSFMIGIAEKRAPILYKQLEAEFLNLFKTRQSLNTELAVKEKYVKMARTAGVDLETFPLNQKLLQSVLNVFYEQLRLKAPPVGIDFEAEFKLIREFRDPVVPGLLSRLDKRFTECDSFIKFKAVFLIDLNEFNVKFSDLVNALIESKQLSDCVFSPTTVTQKVKKLYEQFVPLYQKVYKARLFRSDLLNLFSLPSSPIKKNDDEILKQIDQEMNDRLEATQSVPEGIVPNFPPLYKGFKNKKDIKEMINGRIEIRAASGPVFHFCSNLKYKYLSLYYARFKLPPFDKLIIKEPYIYTTDNLPLDAISDYFANLKTDKEKDNFLKFLVYFYKMQMHYAKMQGDKPLLVKILASSMYINSTSLLLDLSELNTDLLKQLNDSVKDDNISLAYCTFKMDNKDTFGLHFDLDIFEEAYKLYPSKVIVDEFIKIRALQPLYSSKEYIEFKSLYTEACAWDAKPITLSNLPQLVDCLSRYLEAEKNAKKEILADFEKPPIFIETEPISVCIINRLYKKTKADYETKSLAPDQMQNLKEIYRTFPQEELFNSKKFKDGIYPALTLLDDAIEKKVVHYNHVKNEAFWQVKMAYLDKVEQSPFNPLPPTQYLETFGKALLKFPIIDPQMPRITDPVPEDLPQILLRIFLRILLKHFCKNTLEKFTTCIKNNQTDRAEIIFKNLKTLDGLQKGEDKLAPSIFPENFDNFVETHTPKK
jgi:hypothetical protein